MYDDFRLWVVITLAILTAWLIIQALEKVIA